MIWASEVAAQSGYVGEWFAFLLGASVRGTVLLLVASLVCFALKRSSAQTRHLLWKLTFGSLLLLPLLSFALPAWRAPVLPQWQQTRQTGTETEALISTSNRTETPSQALSPERASKEAKAGPLAVLMSHWQALALLIWLTGALLGCLRILAGQLNIVAIAGRARPLAEDSRAELVRSLCRGLCLLRPVRTLKSERVLVPVTVGIFRPVVLLPLDADLWEMARLRMVLLHELVHVKRLDYAVEILVQLACACHWFNPLVWAAASRLHKERERACDDHVLRLGSKASEYASQLLAFARLLPRAGRAPQSLVAITGRTHLEERVRAILDPKVIRHGSNRLAGALLMLACACLVLPLSALRPVAGRTEQGVEGSSEIWSPQSPAAVDGMINAQASEATRTQGSTAAPVGPLPRGRASGPKRRGALMPPPERDDAARGAAEQSLPFTPQSHSAAKTAGANPEIAEATRSGARQAAFKDDEPVLPDTAGVQLRIAEKERCIRTRMQLKTEEKERSVRENRRMLEEQGSRPWQ